MDGMALFCLSLSFVAGFVLLLRFALFAFLACLVCVCAMPAPYKAKECEENP